MPLVCRNRLDSVRLPFRFATVLSLQTLIFQPTTALRVAPNNPTPDAGSLADTAALVRGDAAAEGGGAGGVRGVPRERGLRAALREAVRGPLRLQHAGRVRRGGALRGFPGGGGVLKIVQNRVHEAQTSGHVRADVAGPDERRQLLVLLPGGPGALWTEELGRYCSEHRGASGGRIRGHCRSSRRPAPEDAREGGGGRRSAQGGRGGAVMAVICLLRWPWTSGREIRF